MRSHLKCSQCEFPRLEHFLQKNFELFFISTNRLFVVYVYQTHEQKGSFVDVHYMSWLHVFVFSFLNIMLQIPL